MQSPLKILFIDDHTGLQDGMIFMLQNKNPSLSITGVGTIPEALKKVLHTLLPQNKGKHIVRDEKSYLFDNYKSLSKKEQEVFIHLAEGFDVVEIAKLLRKSEKTILNQRTAVYGKMFIRDRHDLIEKAKLLELLF